MAMLVNSHSKQKWFERGDPSRRLREAWRNGVEVECDDYSYTEARMDLDTGAIILVFGNEFRTVLRSYGSVRWRFKIPVECYDCGNHNYHPGDCPCCGSDKWRLR